MTDIYQIIISIPIIFINIIKLILSNYNEIIRISIINDNIFIDTLNSNIIILLSLINGIINIIKIIINILVFILSNYNQIVRNIFTDDFIITDDILIDTLNSNIIILSSLIIGLIINIIIINILIFILSSFIKISVFILLNLIKISVFILSSLIKISVFILSNLIKDIINNLVFINKNKIIDELQTKLKDVNKCSICIDNTISNCCIPCGHTYCSDCINKTNNCYICRSNITNKIKIYL